MGLFGSSRKAERAEQVQRDRERDEIASEMDRRKKAGYAEMKEWLGELEQRRPPGSTKITDDLLAEVGSPPLPRPIPQHLTHGAVLGAMYAVRGYGAAMADHKSIEAWVNGKDRELSRFWESVKEHLENIAI